MTLLDSMFRLSVRTRRLGLRWLREELKSLRVEVPFTACCLNELIRQADALAIGTDRRNDQNYVQRFRMQLLQEARFVQRWTGSDENVSTDGSESVQSLVRIARKHALPRPWKVTEPPVVEYRRTRPTQWDWTSEVYSQQVAA